MIVQNSVGRNVEVEALILHVGAQTEVHLWKTTAQYGLVVCIDYAIRSSFRTRNILIEAITYINTLLGSVVVEICLCTGDSLVNPTIELTDLLTYVGSVCTRDVRVLTDTQRSHLVLQGTQIGTDVILEGVVTVAIGCAELETAVLHRGCVHGYRGVGYTSLCRNRNRVKQVF